MFMSRAANAGQKAYRVATVTQKMLRLHAVSMQLGADAKNSSIVRVAGKGDESFADSANELLAFVQQHAGGRDPWLLNMVSEYEQGLCIKRTVRSKDLLGRS